MAGAAEVIDLQRYRAERAERVRQPPAPSATPMGAAIAWVPVWIAPVFFFNGSFTPAVSGSAT